MTIFQVQIQNLGKLADATVRVGPLTVLAGVNNTGKSFFSKFLYSTLDALNKDLVGPRLETLAAAALGGVGALENAGLEGREALVERIYRLEEMLARVGEGNVPVGEAHPNIAVLVGEVCADYSKLDSTLRMDSTLTKCKDPDLYLRQLRQLTLGFGGLQRAMGLTAREIAVKGLHMAITNNLIGNFQVPQVSALRNFQMPHSPKSSPVEISCKVENFGDLVINDEACDILDSGEYYQDALLDVFGPPEDKKHSKWLPPWPPFHCDEGVLALRELCSQAIYLESPALWRMKRILEREAFERMRSPRSRLEVSEAPKFFYDLATALTRHYAGEMAFPKIFRHLTEDVIRGKIDLDSFGELEFTESGGGKYSLPSTAMGVTNLGILAMLIERKLVDKGTFLFIDEPESNLHPAWQVEMVRALFALARGGVNVVLATHSVDIVKYLEVHAKENPEDKNLIALNHFTHDGVTGGDADFEDQLSAIQAELTRPFHKLYMRGL